MAFSLKAVYDELENELAALGMECRMCGDCCRFDKVDHILYASTLECEYLIRSVAETSPSLKADSPKLCPFHRNNECQAREGRVLGCRVHFCKPRDPDLLSALSEKYHMRLKSLHDLLGMDWNYMPLFPLAGARLPENRGEAILPMQGAHNMRDLGGYRNGDGRLVKRGLLYRAAELNRLTDEDILYLSRIGLKTVVDFRGFDETYESPDRLPDCMRRIHLPIEPGDFAKMAASMTNVQHTPENEMFVVYRALVENMAPVYREFFKIVSDRDNLPLLFHCTAGKDRTGVAAALLLSVFGVERDTIFQDYLLSNACLEPKYGGIMRRQPELLPMFMADKRYLETTFSYLDGYPNGMCGFLTGELGVDVRALRDLFVG